MVNGRGPVPADLSPYQLQPLIDVVAPEFGELSALTAPFHLIKFPSCIRSSSTSAVCTSIRYTHFFLAHRVVAEHHTQVTRYMWAVLMATCFALLCSPVKVTQRYAGLL